MRHVLFVHYHFLPVHNVAVKRLVGYARQLPAFGWRVHVLTREWRGLDEADPSWGLSWEPELEAVANCTIHRVPAPPLRAKTPAHPPPPALRRAVALGQAALPGRVWWALVRARRVADMAFGDYPDEFRPWVNAAVAIGLRVARERGVDLVMSYCPPESNHLVARRLARRLGVPWVPFFGDLYGFLEPRLPARFVEGYLRRAWHRWCLEPAAACAGVSPAMVDYLARTYGKSAKLIHTGFDPDEFRDGNHANRPARLVVSHVGSVYPDDQRPEILFDGLDRLLARHPEIASRLEVRFVGSKCDDRLRRMLAGRPAASVCHIRPKVDSVTAASLVAASDGLLAFTCSAFRDRYGTLSYPTKIFEAFGAGRPILAVPADGDWVDDLLARTGGGTSARDAGEVASTIWEWYAGWANDGRVPYRGDAEALAAFSRVRQVERLARLFDSVCRP